MWSKKYETKQLCTKEMDANQRTTRCDESDEETGHVWKNESQKGRKVSASNAIQNLWIIQISLHGFFLELKS